MNKRLMTALLLLTMAQAAGMTTNPKADLKKVQTEVKALAKAEQLTPEDRGAFQERLMELQKLFNEAKGLHAKAEEASQQATKDGKTEAEAKAAAKTAMQDAKAEWKKRLDAWSAQFKTLSDKYPSLQAPVAALLTDLAQWEPKKSK